MNLRLAPDGRTITIELPTGQSGKLFVGDALQGEFGLGADGPKDFEAELRGARAAGVACRFMSQVIAELREQDRKPDHVVTSGPRRAAAYAAGFEAGLLGEERVIGEGAGAARCAPEHKLSGPTHSRGWGLGDAIRRAIEISKGLPEQE